MQLNTEAFDRIRKCIADNKESEDWERDLIDKSMSGDDHDIPDAFLGIPAHEFVN